MTGTTAAGGQCSFPSSWHGRWLQSDASATVVITHNEISNKGSCYDEHREYFLVENRLLTVPASFDLLDTMVV